jgi:RNA 2',3'-cyclic 3'-phosphodiesterase
VRVFVALELPSAVKEAAAAIQRELMESGAAIGWVRGEGMHLTLKFFGEVSPDRLPEIETALAAAAEGTGSVEIKVRGLGAFPNPRSPRVIWAGIHPSDDRLARLQERIDQAVAPLGFPPEKREFRPHLTLGRIKSPRGLDGVMKAMAARHDFSAGECTLDRLHLFQSELKPGGAVYTKLWSVAL